MNLPHRRMPERHAFNQNILAAMWLNQVRSQITFITKHALAHGRALGNHLLKQSPCLARVGIALLPSAALPTRPRPPVFAISLAVNYSFTGDRDVLLFKG